MDTIGGRNFIFWTVKQVKKYVNDNQSKETTKKVEELISGLLLAICLQKSNQIKYCIGFPLKKTDRNAKPEDGVSIEQLLHDTESIDDTDIDIALATEGELSKSLCLVQLARIPNLAIGCNAENILFSILKKKCRAPKDDKLNLVIIVQDHLNLDIDKIRAFLKELLVPFAKILIIGKVKEKEDLFQMLEIWPEVLASQEVSIN